MDETLVNLISPPAEGTSGIQTFQTKIRFTDDTGQIEIAGADGLTSYTLRPLAELYATDVGTRTADPMDNTFTPLFMAIELCIRRHDQAEPSLTDAKVEITLNHLGLAPEAGIENDPLAKELQLQLRLALSVGHYSRQEVRTTCRKIGRSIARHTKLAGPRGYLSFIREQLRG